MEIPMLEDARMIIPSPPVRSSTVATTGMQSTAARRARDHLLPALVTACTLLGSSITNGADSSAQADEAAIRKADAEWVAAAQSRQVDAWLKFYTADAVVLPPNNKVANGRENARKSV